MLCSQFRKPPVALDHFNQLIPAATFLLFDVIFCIAHSPGNITQRVPVEKTLQNLPAIITQPQEMFAEQLFFFSFSHLQFDTVYIQKSLISLNGDHQPLLFFQLAQPDKTGDAERPLLHQNKSGPKRGIKGFFVFFM